MTKNDQSQLRELAKKKRLALTPLQQQLAAKRILVKIKALPEFKRAQHIAAYSAMAGELNLQKVIELALLKEKNIYLPTLVQGSKQLTFFPYTKNQKLSKNHFGIKQTLKGRALQIKKLDLVLMPLVAFDTKGNRIGMGGGFYDFSFQHLNKKRFRKTLVIGVAHDCQKVEAISSNDWDVAANKIISV
jgi:5-formyltetrahydrofolate cyclo-ligase